MVLETSINSVLRPGIEISTREGYFAVCKVVLIVTTVHYVESSSNDQLSAMSLLPSSREFLLSCFEEIALGPPCRS